jgi:hypothetical protein
MKKALIILLLVAGCDAPNRQGGNDAAAPAGEASAGPLAAPGGASPARAGSLTGLYEGPRGETVDQLCMIDQGPGRARFGLVVWGSDMHSCLGEGQAERKGDQLLLRMSGDSSCEISATVKDNMIALPGAVPEGCAYYCGTRARLVGVSFTRSGGGLDDAMRAKDLVGDPLCGDRSN